MPLFRGYVPTKNKKCLMKFKDQADLLSLESVSKLSEYAGILAEGIILIDVDDYEQSEILMNIVEDMQLRCRVYETTRGKHFLFKNKIVERCKTGCRLAIGLTSDIKLGSRNSYSILKYDNIERKIIYDIFNDEEYQDVPIWLTPVKSNIDFVHMEAGDGRNQSLFNYILTLQSMDFSIEDIRETLRIINEYVLKTPLADSEIETILRDESFQKPMFFKDKSFLFDKFATFLKNNDHIVKINNQLHVYRDGIYVHGHDKIEAEMIRYIPNLSKSKRAEVMAYLELLTQDNQQMSAANYIAFKNGLYDLDTDEFMDFTPNVIVTNKINFNYNPQAHSDLIENTLDKLSCYDDNVRSLLEEVVGYCFYRRNELRTSFILIGDKANGKSTYLDMIKTLLGDENTSSLDLKELGDRFKTAELFGKLANIGDDIGDDFIPNPAAFKKLVSGESMNVERKGQDPFDFNNYSKLLFSANNIPRIKDKSGAVINRLVIIPFDARFSKDDPDYDPYIKYKLRQPDCMEALIVLGLQGLKRVLKNYSFTKSDRVEKEIEEYEKNNNPILIFFDEIGVDEIENEVTREVYKQYQEFCLSNNFQPMSNIEFSKQVKKHFDFIVVDRKVNGKKCRVFSRRDKQ